MALLCNLCWQAWALWNDFSKSNLRQICSSASFYGLKLGVQRGLTYKSIFKNRIYEMRFDAFTAVPLKNVLRMRRRVALV
jgi:hypothetical protein